MNRILDNISQWCAANKLSLSPAKTCYSIFGNCSYNCEGLGFGVFLLVVLMLL